MAAPALLLPLALLLGGGEAPPADLTPQLGQRWTVQTRPADGEPGTWTLRLSGRAASGGTAWEAEVTGLPGASRGRLEVERERAGRRVLTVTVQSFDGRSQPDLRTCVVVGPQETAGRWTGLYGFGLSGRRQLNLYLEGGEKGDLLGGCTLSVSSARPPTAP